MRGEHPWSAWGLAEASFLLCRKDVVSVLVRGLAPVLLCPFNKGCKGWPGLPEPQPTGVSLLPHSRSPLACFHKEEIGSREPGAAWAEVVLGVRGSVGTNTPRLVLPRCHHSSVFWTRRLPFHISGFKVLHFS